MSTIIQATLDYSLFHRIESNRDINPSHLKRLMASIQAKNYLYLFPIIINKDMEIVDGQHRLIAARELKLPIFYLIDDKITKAEIAMVNSNRKGWAAIDYIEYYAKEGNAAYKKITTLLSEYPRLRPQCAMQLIANNLNKNIQGGGGSTTNIMRTGNVNDADYDLAVKILLFAKKINSTIDYSFSRAFILSLKHALEKTTISKDDALAFVFKKINELPLDAKGITTFMPYFKNMIPVQEEKSGPRLGTKYKPRKESLEKIIKSNPKHAMADKVSAVLDILRSKNVLRGVNNDINKGVLSIEIQKNIGIDSAEANEIIEHLLDIKLLKESDNRVKLNSQAVRVSNKSQGPKVEKPVVKSQRQVSNENNDATKKAAEDGDWKRLRKLILDRLQESDEPLSLQDLAFELKTSRDRSLIYMVATRMEREKLIKKNHSSRYILFVEETVIEEE